jgi:hypothetical protein
MESSERRGCAVIVPDADSSNARPRYAEIIAEQLLGEIEMGGGDRIRVKWLEMRQAWPVLSVWIYRLGHDGTWFPIPNRGVRVAGRHVRALIDAVNAAAPLEAEWRRQKNQERKRERARQQERQRAVFA